jgi:chromosome segregation ATPase
MSTQVLQWITLLSSGGLVGLLGLLIRARAQRARDLASAHDLLGQASLSGIEIFKASIAQLNVDLVSAQAECRLLNAELHAARDEVRKLSAEKIDLRERIGALEERLANLEGTP